MILAIAASILLTHPEPDRAADISELTRVKEVDWNGYYRRRDVAGLDAFLADGFIHFTSDGSIESKQDALDYVRENEWPGAANNFAYKVTDIQFYGADYANVFGVGSFDGAECRMDYVSSNVLKRGEDGWHPMFSHSSPAFCPGADGEGSAAMDDELAVQSAISAVYAVISGPVGQGRDWDAMRALFTEDARLTPIGPNGHRAHDIDGYIERSEDFLVGQGFHEVETGRRIEIYGNLAQVWSAYEGRAGSHDGPIIVTGINSFQLVKQDDGWKVFSILWQAADDDLPVPADLAGGGGE